MTNTNTNETLTVLTREGTIGREPWKHILVIQDNRVALLDMVPAMFGWNLREITIQGDAEWCGMTREQIVAFKLNQGDTCIRPADASEIEFAKRKLGIC